MRSLIARVLRRTADWLQPSRRRWRPRWPNPPAPFPSQKMPLSSRAEIGARLKEERQKLGISQAQLGKLCGVSGRTVLTWEMGESKLPAQQLLALANHGIDFVYVFCGERISYKPTDVTFQPPY